MHSDRKVLFFVLSFFCLPTIFIARIFTESKILFINTCIVYILLLVLVFTLKTVSHKKKLMDKKIIKQGMQPELVHADIQNAECVLLDKTTRLYFGKQYIALLITSYFSETHFAQIKEGMKISADYQAGTITFVSGNQEQKWNIVAEGMACYNCIKACMKTFRERGYLVFDEEENQEGQ